MPEHAEILLMADYINERCEYVVFQSAHKHPISKQDFDASKLPKNFFIKAITRGKEIQLIHFDNDSSKEVRLTITMGMSGNFFINDGSPSKWPMLTWVSRDVKLELLDHRRFAKWDFRDFNPDRGPDVVTEHVEFKKLIKDSISAGAKAFDKPLCEILLDQKYFNGIGNYLLAEILGRLNVNPFQKMNDLSKKKLNELLSLCKKIPQQAYVAGGAQLKDWKNPNKVSKKKFDKWKKFYKGRNCLSVVTDTGRNFWYHKKWNRFSKYGSED